MPAYGKACWNACLNLLYNIVIDTRHKIKQKLLSSRWYQNISFAVNIGLYWNGNVAIFFVTGCTVASSCKDVMLSYLIYVRVPPYIFFSLMEDQSWDNRRYVPSGWWAESSYIRNTLLHKWINIGEGVTLSLQYLRGIVYVLDFMHCTVYPIKYENVFFLFVLCWLVHQFIGASCVSFTHILHGCFIIDTGSTI